MRQFNIGSSLASAAIPLLFLSQIPLTWANPYPRDDMHDAAGGGFLMNRACDSYCGFNNQYCCSAGQQCYTSAGIAGCSGGVAAGGGGFPLYTTTWTETRTFTSTISSWLPAATTPASSGNGADCVPPAGSGQIACGSICCANWQYCAYKGQCMPNAGAGASYATVITSVGVVTTQFSAPYRVTSGTTIVQTQTSTGGTIASATTTGTSTATPAPVTTSGNQLSGGAIAGIVIGVIAGVILLLLLCACCLVRGAWHGLLAIFGIGKKKDSERVEVIEERYSRHGSAHGGRPAHRTWFGGAGRPATVSSARREEKKKGSGAGWLAASAGAMALLLGLRRDNKRKEAASHSGKTRSDFGSSYYSDSYTASSPSSASSDRRTRTTRHSRTSRGTRASRR